MIDTKDTYNKIAQDWHTDHATDTWWIPGTDQFLALLPESPRVLDVGCAGGHKAKYMADKGAIVTGVDNAESFIPIAKQEAPEADFQVADMHDLSTVQGVFDGVYASASLLHIKKADARAVVQQLASKVAPGGFFYVAVKEKRPDGAEEEIVTEDDYGYSYTRFFSFYTAEELSGYFQDAGLHVVSTNVTPVKGTNWLEVVGQKMIQTL